MSAKFSITSKLTVLAFLSTITSSYADDFRYYAHRVEEVDRRDQRLAKNEVTNYRLPNDTRPLEYEVTLQTWIHEPKFEFTGQVLVKVKAEEATDTVTLHYRRTNITSAVLYTADGATDLSDIDGFRLDTEREFIEVTARQALIKGTIYQLDIRYNGVLREDNVGFYRSSYTDENGAKAWIATTQFSPTDARHAFPCYDEPGIKAVFNIRIEHDESYHAIANMPGERSARNAQGRVMTTFEPTPLMQTYILGFTVSKFEALVDTSTGIPHRVYARPATIRSGAAEFGLQTGLRILKKHEELLGLEYELPKLDQVAIPDFYFNAMENWGLITYREEIVLINDTHSPLRQKQRSATVISHELSHFYFGNLVSPKWWQYLWMKEGFATFFEFYTASLVFPEWRLMELFVVDKLQNVFQSDSYAATRAMTYSVGSPTEVSAVFDNISYDKAGCVLRMLMHAMGMDTAFKGLHYYLVEMAYQGAIPADFYRNLQNAINENPALHLNINDIYESWALQPGYPVVHVSREITSTNVILRLSQEQYWSKETEPRTNRLWWIPFNVATSKIPDFITTTPDGWLGTASATFTLDRTDDGWVILNKQQTGYYRVNYDPELWRLIGEQLQRNASVIHPGNRGQLVDDAFNLARSGYIDYDVVLNLIEFLNDEVDYLPWSPANIGLKYMKQMLFSSDNFKEFEIIVGNMIENLYEKVGFDDPLNDPYFAKFVRNIAIDWACQLNVSDCVDRSLKTMSSHLASATKLSPDTKATVYCIGVRHSDETFDGLWTKFQTSEDQYERSLIITSLGCSLNPSKVDEFLQKSINNDPTIRHQEKSRILSAVIGNDELGVDKAIDFIAFNHAAIREKYDRLSALSTAVIALSKKVNTRTRYEKFTNLLNQLQSGYISSAAYTLATTTCDENLKWIDKHGETVLKWMQTRNIGNLTFSSFGLTLFAVILSLCNRR